MKSFNRPWSVIKNISVFPVKDGIVEVKVASPYYCLSPQLGLYQHPSMKMLHEIGNIAIRPARIL